jgi:hypothetical protein
VRLSGSNEIHSADGPGSITYTVDSGYPQKIDGPWKLCYKTK